MGWNEETIPMQRREFVELATADGANISLLCRRYGISRKTAYKWIGRAESRQEGWAEDRSRKPASSPEKASEEVESLVVDLRLKHPAWGARKLRRRLEDMGKTGLPSPSTITAILHRRGLISERASVERAPMTRFERERPNELWQMDFKGAIKMANGALCHPLTVIDDHSRFALCVAACPDERAQTVQAALTAAFRLYGLPVRMLMDNGSCWGRVEARYTLLNAWQLRLGIAISHGRPYHPQTQGKDERFNRTLKAEALEGRNHADLPDCESGFASFRQTYNHERPHEALGMAVPASRYTVSVFPFPETLPPIQYLESDIVRRVGTAGYISLGKTHYHVGRAFAGNPVGLRATERDGVHAVYYCQHVVAEIDLRSGTCVAR